MLSTNALKNSPPVLQGRGSMQSPGVMHFHPNPMVQGKEARLLRWGNWDVSDAAKIHIFWLQQKMPPNYGIVQERVINSSHDSINILPIMHTTDNSSFKILTNVSYVFCTLLIGVNFNIRRKRVLLILFVLIFKYKNCRLNYFI